MNFSKDTKPKDLNKKRGKEIVKEGEKLICIF